MSKRIRVLHTARDGQVKSLLLNLNLGGYFKLLIISDF